MTDNLPIMVTAVCIAIAVMMFAATPISNFIRRHPTTKMLALAFLLLIGVALFADALHFHVPRGYLYFAIAFSLMVETLNLVATRRRKRARSEAHTSELQSPMRISYAVFCLKKTQLLDVQPPEVFLATVKK